MQLEACRIIALRLCERYQVLGVIRERQPVGVRLQMQVSIPGRSEGLGGDAVEETARGVGRDDVGVDVDVNLAVGRLCSDASQGFIVCCR